MDPRIVEVGAYVAAYGVVLVAVLTVIVHIYFAAGVLADAKGRKNAGQPVFLDPQTWALASLLGGLLAVTVYWVVHHSTLRR